MIEAMSLVLPTPNEKAFSVRYASSKFIADRTVQFYVHWTLDRHMDLYITALCYLIPKSSLF